VYTLRLEPNRQRQGNSAKIAGPQGSVIFFYIFLIVLDTVKGVSIFNSEILVQKQKNFMGPPFKIERLGHEQKDREIEWAIGPNQQETTSSNPSFLF
jgi:hypothetical protein